MQRITAAWFTLLASALLLSEVHGAAAPMLKRVKRQYLVNGYNMPYLPTIPGVGGFRAKVSSLKYSCAKGEGYQRDADDCNVFVRCVAVLSRFWVDERQLARYVHQCAPDPCYEPLFRGHRPPKRALPRVLQPPSEQERRAEQLRQQAERAEQLRVEAERKEAERVERERIETERIEKERKEAERVEKERIETERIEKERKEAERVEKERIETERIEKERIEAERVEKERIETERIEKERIEAERIEQERIEHERIEAERMEKERIEAEAEAQRLADEERKRAEEEEEDFILAGAHVPGLLGYPGTGPLVQVAHCDEPGFFEHPSDCSRFAQCYRADNGSAVGYYYSCPPNTLFNPRVPVCEPTATVPRDLNCFSPAQDAAEEVLEITRS